MLKPIDTVIFGMIGELSGRNESEHIGSLVMPSSKSRAIWFMAKTTWLDEILIDTSKHLGGVLVSA